MAGTHKRDKYIGLEAEFDNFATDIIDTDTIDVNTGQHILNTGESILQYPADTSGLRSMVTDAAQFDVMQIAPGSYDLGTSGLTLPDNVGFVSGGAKNSVILNVSDGIGTVLQAGAANYLQGITIQGDANGASDDNGIVGPTTDTAPTMFSCAVFDMWRALHLDASFNGRFIACQFSNNRTGQTSGIGYVDLETLSGSNNDNRFWGCYFGSNSANRSIRCNANDVWVDWCGFEANTNLRLISHESGDGCMYNVIGHANEPTGAAISINDGEGVVMAKLDAGSNIGAGIPPLDITVAGWTSQLNSSGYTADPSAVAGSSIGGFASESANAETPQQEYEVGTIVDFTDSGDGSGTGVYLTNFAGGFVQLA